MALLKTGLNLYYDEKVRLPSAVQTKNELTIGFEYEVPMDNYFDEDADGDEYSDYFDSAGILNHYECGGLELRCPYSETLNQQKAFARRLINTLHQPVFEDVFNLSGNNDTSCCGIHVHVGRQGLAKNVTHDQVLWMLNREESAPFFEALADREEGTDYTVQGESLRFTEYTCKDCARDRYGFLCDDGAPQFKMRYNTIEYRMFDAKADLILPALDFCHSLTKFMALNPESTYLSEWRDWVMKQPYYNDIKSHKAMELLP